jgi:hypothetical protein
MIDAISYKDIVRAVSEEQMRYSARLIAFDWVDAASQQAMININEKIKRHSFVAVLFCNPNSSFCKSEILESLSYLHHRSKQYINIFCCGYGAHWPLDKYPDLKVVTKIEGIDWSYSDNAFVSAVEEFEERTKWRYSGENELLLLDVSPSSDHEELNINNAIVCNLEKMKADGAFRSVRVFFEDIIRYASSTKNSDAWEFSDKIGGDVAKNLLKDFMLGLLPKKLEDSYRKSENFAIKKIY